MVGTEPPFARIMTETSEFSPPVQSHNRIFAESAETHRKNIEDRGSIRLSAGVGADRYLGRFGKTLFREDGVGSPLIAFRVKVLFRTERMKGILVVRTLVDQCDAFLVKRGSIEVVLKKVLVYLRGDGPKYVAQVADHRIVAKN